MQIRSDLVAETNVPAGRADKALTGGQAAIGARASRALHWLMLKLLFVYGVRLGRTAVLARLLSPADFGLFGLAMVLYNGLQVFSELGTGKYLIQRSTLDEEVLGNVWSINIIRGAVTTTLLLTVSPVYGWMTGESHVGPVLAIIALTALVAGFVNPLTFLAERQLNFKRIVLYELTSTLINAAITILLAIGLQSVIALAWGMLASSVVDVVLSFALFANPPRPGFSNRYIKEVWNVGKHFIVIAMGSFIMTQGDNLIVGLLLTPAHLGLYMLAYRLSEIPTIVLNTVANRAVLPIVSRLQSDRKRLRQVSERIFDLQLAALIPCVIGLVLFADPLVRVLYGSKWTDAAFIVKFLAFALLGRGLTHVAVPYILGTGNFSFSSRSKLFETVLFLLAALACGHLWGIKGVAMGVGIGYLSAAAVRVWFVSRHSGTGLTRFIEMMGAAAAASVVAAVTVVSVRSLFAAAPDWLELIASGCVFVAVYAGVNMVFRKELSRDIHRAFFSSLGPKPVAG